jgi:predicted transcriptional regulator
MSSLNSDDHSRSWTFLTSHTQVLLCLARDPHVRLRDVAASVGITERATQRVLRDLVEAGYIERERIGRRNQYNINPSTPMRHAAQREHEIGELLQVLTEPAAQKRAR